MAWISPSTRSTGTLITASIWNQDVVANAIALFDPPTDFVDLSGETDKTTTSTSFVDVDAAGDPDFSLSVVIAGDTMVVHFHGILNSGASNNAFVDFTVDGVRQGAADGISGVRSSGANAIGASVNFTRLVTGLSAGTRTVVLQWRSSGGVSITLYTNTLKPQFWASER